jgi:hypothetical protein
MAGQRKFAVWIFDATLVQTLRSECSARKISVSQFVTQAIRAQLERPAATVTPPSKHFFVTAARVRRTRLDATGVDASVGRGKAAIAVPIEPTAPDDLRSCRREGCRHAQRVHTRSEQGACGIMGCACARFMA